MTEGPTANELEATFTVSELCGDVRDVLGRTFDSIWVVGEVQRVRPNRNGHLFFELIEKGPADEIVGKLEAVLWRRDHEEVRRALSDLGQEIVDGQEMRCRAGLDFYAPFGRVQLVVREVDVVFALGKLAARRRRTLEALRAADLVERNGRLELVEHPLDLALVTARGSAAYHDFLETLRESGFGFRVIVIDAAVQGRDAERSVSSALAAASRLSVDACVLIRGGGSRTDLAAFDSRRVAEAVARCRVPVLTGLGHQIDESIADLVAHTALKTPTKVAEHLVDRVCTADEAQRRLGARLAEAVTRRLDRGRERLSGAERRLGVTRLRLTTARVRLEEIAAFLRRAAPRRPAALRRELDRLHGELLRWAPRLIARRGERAAELTAQLGRLARARLVTARERLAGRARLVAQLGPQRALERGFSITRDESGRVVRRRDQIGYGQVLTTEVADGTIRSRVEQG